MAILQGDKLHGSEGDLVYSVDRVTKKQVVRRKPKKVRNPNSKKQRSHRGSFGDISKLSPYMTEALNIGLKKHALQVNR